MTEVSHPGVYIEEVPSGNRTITGVSTSITAFIGRTAKGPVDRATRITNYGSFEKQFGGLWQHSPLSYAVRQFFQNGGADAVIVRIANTLGAPATIDLNAGDETISLEAAMPGPSGHFLRLGVSTEDADTLLTVSEYTRTRNGDEILVREEVYSGSDGASLETALAAAVDANTAMVRTAEGSDGWVTLPDNLTATDLTGGTPIARPAAAILPSAATDETPALTIEASDNGAEANDNAISIYHSRTSPDHFTIVAEEQQASGEYTELGRVENTTAAELDANWKNEDEPTDFFDRISLVDDHPQLNSRPLAVERRHFSGGTDDAKASASFLTTGLAVAAANPGSWGNRIKLSVDHETSNPGDDALFNLIVEATDSQGRSIASEEHRNLSVDPEAARFVTTVLHQASALIRIDARGLAIPRVAPDETTSPIRLHGGYDGGEITTANITGTGMQGSKKGLYLLEDTDLFNIMVIPPLTPDTDVPEALWTEALAYCKKRRAILIIDPPAIWHSPDEAINGVDDMSDLRDPNSVLYFPRVQAVDPLRDNMLSTFVPSGIMAGLMSRTDAERGVWKAPAGPDAWLVGVSAFSYALIDGEVGQLNPLGINCLQAKLAFGPVAWGGRTLVGADRLASEWKYLPVRRVALMIQESIYRGMQWAEFEPNDAALWQQLRLAGDNFMNQLYRRGAFQGSSPDEAYFVKCDSETTTQADIDLGIVNMDIGFRPLKPAEFVVIRIRQIAGQSKA
ncbi:MAG: hypothetical protein JJU00_18285 [Opitutales bacterium]|nr:hypothetical protein [Opitutales bacterium]